MESKEAMVKRALRRIGIRNILIGIVILCLAIIALIAFALSLSSSWLVVWIIRMSMAIGFILFGYGIRQYRAKGKVYYSKSKEMFGVEEPDCTWICPKCNTVNPNTGFTCNNCSYSLK